MDWEVEEKFVIAAEVENTESSHSPIGIIGTQLKLYPDKNTP